MEKVGEDRGEKGKGKKDHYVLSLGTGWIVVAIIDVNNIGELNFEESEENKFK